MSAASTDKTSRVKPTRQRAKITVFFAVVLLPMLFAAPAHGRLDLGLVQIDLGEASGPRTSALCTFTFSVYMSPGFSLTRQQVDFESRGETGSVHCTGKLGGHAVTGPGSAGLEGSHIGDCVSDSGSGRYFMTVPTESGPKHFEGTFNESRMGLNGLVEGSEPGARFRGTYVVVPTRGDCVSTPITETLLVVTTIHSDA